LYYLLSGKSRGKIKELEEKAAVQIFQLAEKASTQFMKDFCYYVILSQYPDTQVAKKLGKNQEWLEKMEANRAFNPLLGLNPYLILPFNTAARGYRILGHRIPTEGSLMGEKSLCMNYSLLKGGQIISSNLYSNKTNSYIWAGLSTHLNPTVSFSPPLLEKHSTITGVITLQPGFIGISPRIKFRTEKEADYRLYTD